jgi:hypothetical protein
VDASNPTSIGGRSGPASYASPERRGSRIIACRAVTATFGGNLLAKESHHRTHIEQRGTHRLTLNGQVLKRSDTILLDWPDRIARRGGSMPMLDGVSSSSLCGMVGDRA